MSESKPRPSARPSFSLHNLLTLTAVIAIGTAVGLAYLKNRAMLQQRDELLALSSRLQIANVDELASAEMPRVANDFNSWRVHVPQGEDYELRLGIGEISAHGVPPIVGRVRLAAGRHRVTLQTSDSPAEKFRYSVFVDGERAFEKTMGSEWMPDGWTSSSGLSWPHELQGSPTPLQLSARSYRPDLEFGRGRYFNGQSDEFVTRNGYRLWIDLASRNWGAVSPFIGFPGDSYDQEIGLRDGLRYKPSRQPYLLTFTRPSLDTHDPVLTIAAEFHGADGAILSEQTAAFQSWQLRDASVGEKDLKWQADPTQSIYTAFLQARVDGSNALQPRLELRWDANRPDEVGLRLAETPSNAQISRWRLRILDGTRHLWREMQIGDRRIDAESLLDEASASSSETTVALDLEESSAEQIHLRWQTNETLPLQVLEREQKSLAGLDVYQGLPLTLGLQLPATMNPTLRANLAGENPTAAGAPFPGGPVLSELQIDLEPGHRDWIWLEAKGKR